MLSATKSEQELFVLGTGNLMDDLLTFVRPSFGGKVIFVGAPAQLPPVGAPVSYALEASFFERKGLKVEQAELTEVLRQAGDSVILKNAMQIRGLLQAKKRCRLVFEEKKGNVEALPPGKLLDTYMEARSRSGRGGCVVICFSNRMAADYNRDIRSALYGREGMPLQVGDVLLVAQNNYLLDRMNGEFVTVLSVGERSQQSASVPVQRGGVKVRVTITMEFLRIRVPDGEGIPRWCMLLLDFLESGDSSLGVDEQRALYVNFRMRHPGLKPGTKDFQMELMGDPYFNCLRAKYGYAVTGHKCQGGEWAEVFVDYSKRTGLSDDCLRWAYTATTRAQERLYFANLPHITPFTKFRIDPVQKCSKMNEECRRIGEVVLSPFHDASAPGFLHAKWMCVHHNMYSSPYKIERVESRPYMEIYYILTPAGVERFDLRYKQGGIFLKAAPASVSPCSEAVCRMLDDEHAMPLVFDYQPSDNAHERLFNLIRSACDGLGTQLTNVVEHKEDYSVNYYFRTSGSFSCLKVYVNQNGAVTYGKPMSLLGPEDKELLALMEEIRNHLE